MLICRWACLLIGDSNQARQPSAWPHLPETKDYKLSQEAGLGENQAVLPLRFFEPDGELTRWRVTPCSGATSANKFCVQVLRALPKVRGHWGRPGVESVAAAPGSCLQVGGERFWGGARLGVPTLQARRLERMENVAHALYASPEGEGNGFGRQGTCAGTQVLGAPQREHFG